MLATAALATVEVVRRAQFQRSSSVGIPGARCQEEDVTRVGSPGTLRQAVGVITITGNWGTALALLARGKAPSSRTQIPPPYTAVYRAVGYAAISEKW